MTSASPSLLDRIKTAGDGLRRTPTRLALDLVLAASIQPGAIADDGPAPRLTIHPAKSEYVQGEPIGIVVTIENPSTEEIRLPLSYYELPMTIDIDRDGRPIRPWRPRIGWFSGFAPTTYIPGRGAWRRTIYTNLGTRPAPPGAYAFRYSFDTALSFTSTHGLRGRGEATLAASGRFVARVRAPAPGELDRVLEGHRRLLLPRPDLLDGLIELIYRKCEAVEMSEWDGGEGVRDLAGQIRSAAFDIRERRDEAREIGAREALEALANIPNPIVIPYLADSLKTEWSVRGFEVLVRFHGWDAARHVVLAALESDSVEIVLRTLDWLYDDDYALTPDEMKTLLGRMRSLDGPSSEVYDYIKAIGPDRYRELAPEIAEDLESVGPSDLLVRSGTLDLLAAWGVPRSPAIGDALDGLNAMLRTKRRTRADLILPTLSRWHVHPPTDVLRDMLDAPDEAGSTHAAVLELIRRADRREDRVLQPLVVKALRSRWPEVVAPALRVLRRWNYVLTDEDRRVLQPFGPPVREILRDYLSPPAAWRLDSGARRRIVHDPGRVRRV